MHNIWLIFQREYLTRVRKKLFILTTLLVPLGFAMLFVVQIWLLSYGNESLYIAVKNDNDKIVMGNVKGVTFIEEYKSLELLKSDYKNLNYDGVLYIPKADINYLAQVQYYSERPLGSNAKRGIQRKLNEAVRKQKLAALGVEDVCARATADIRVNETLSGGKGGRSGVAAAAGGLMGFLIYLSIFIYGTMVMRGVIEEKSNRIVEVMLSSVRPFKLMIGKILGIGAVGFTQFVIWAILLGALYFIIGLVIVGSGWMPAGGATAAQPEAEEMLRNWESISGNISDLSIGKLLLCFLFYFFGGYLLYAALFAALGAAINDDGDAQSLTLIVSLPIIVSFLILTAILDKPDSGLAFWSSMIPFSSPIIMPARVAFGIPLWQLLLSMFLLLGGIFAAVWIAAKIYRVGILIQGKKISVKELTKWLKYD